MHLQELHYVHGFGQPSHGKESIRTLLVRSWGSRSSSTLEGFEMTSTTRSKTIAVPRHLSAACGLPEQVVTDNGPQFTSDKFQAFVLNSTIHVQHTGTCCAPYDPASKELAERFVQTFKQAMKASGKQGHSLSHCLANFLLTYRSTPHATTGVAPCKLFLQ